MKLVKISVFIFIILVINACHKDIDESNKKTTLIETPTIFKEIIGNISGYVYDENNQPIENATVILYNGTTTTNKYGIFSFNDIKLDKHGTYLKVEKQGYINGSDFIYPDQGTVLSYINMLKIDNYYSFNAEEGGEINIDGGGKITFSQNSIINSDGSDFSGKVNVTAKKLSTDDAKLSDKMPGDLRGQDRNGNTVVLGTYGMMVVELRADNGKKLNLKPESVANIEFPVSDNLLENAPDKIPLWYFDETKGIWIEEGSAILSDGKYIGDVAHFSWWNCDAPFPVVHMCVKVLFDDGKPAINYMVNIEVENVMSRNGITNSEGVICGKIPKGKKLILNVKNPLCYKIVKTIDIGPFYNDVILDDIIIPTPMKLGIGKVMCNDNATNLAQVILKYSSPTITETIIVPVDENGFFDLGLSLSNCTNITSAEIFAYNILTGDASNTYILDINSNNDNIILNVCNDCSYSVEIIPEYITICDNTNLSLEAKSSGNGNYSYLWSTGETTPKININENAIYCVTVTETSLNCEVIKCISIQTNQILTIIDSIVINPYCGLNNGKIIGESYGGIPPYTYYVTGPNGFTASTFIVENLEEGAYTYTVTDAGGCSISKNITLEMDKNHEVTFTTYYPPNCDPVKLYAHVKNTVNYNDLTYLWSNGETSREIEIENSGNYCVTVYEGNDCEISHCEYVETKHSPFLPDLSSCNKNLYTYDNYEDVSIYQIWGNIKEYHPGEQIEIDVLDHGYSFFAIYDETFYCGQIEYAIDLPQLVEGVSIDSVRNVSCGTCQDGQIFYTVNSGNNCFECEVGNTEIYALDDLNNDLSSDNNAGILDTGNYYIVVLDKNSGCFIAHEEVKIE